MKHLLLHVGLGKTATTSLQYSFFKELSRLKKIKYYGPFEINNYFNPKRDFKYIHPYYKVKKKFKDLQMTEYSIISYESLSGFFFDPFNYEKCAKINQKIFGKKTHILLTIRKPTDFINSLYAQFIRENILKRPEDIFLKKKDYSQKIKKYEKNKRIEYWSYEDLNFDKLINIYKNYFKKVTVIKYESIINNSFIKKFNFIPLSKDEEKYLSESLIKTKTNKAFGLYSIYFLITLEKIFKVSKLNNFINEIVKKISQKKKKSFLNKILLISMKYLNMVYLTSITFDKILPYKSFKINLDNSDFKRIRDLDKKYNKIKEKTYINTKLK